MGNKVMYIVDEDNEKVEAELLCAFLLSEYNKRYAIYTFGETDENSNTTIYVMQVEKDKLLPIETEEEWTKIKEIIKVMSKQVGEV